MDITHEQIEALWDELAGYGASQTDKALSYLLEQLSLMINAQQAGWFVTARMSTYDDNDPAYGWRLTDLYSLHEKTLSRTVYNSTSRDIKNGEVDESIAARLREAGTFRVRTLRNLMPAEWFKGDYFQNSFAAVGRHDGLFVAIPLGHDIESWFGFYRINSEIPCFSKEEMEIIRLATRPLKWFHRQVALNHGLLLAEKGVTPSERRVLNQLLKGSSTAEIAANLQLSEETVKTYSVRICKKYNVKNRASLLGLWLNG